MVSACPSSPSNKASKEKFRYVGHCCEEGESDYLVFENYLLFPDVSIKDLKCFHINKNNPEIKKYLKGGEIEWDKNFIIHFGMPNEINKEGKYRFDEFSKELEILEV